MKDVIQCKWRIRVRFKRFAWMDCSMKVACWFRKKLGMRWMLEDMGQFVTYVGMSNRRSQFLHWFWRLVTVLLECYWLQLHLNGWYSDTVRSMYLFCHTWDTDCRLWHGLDTLCIQNCSIILKGLPQKKKKKFRCHANIATSAVNSVIVGNPIKKIHKVLTLEKYVETENVKRLQRTIKHEMD